MCTHCDVTSIGGDGEDVGCAIEGADSHPPTIIAETHVLDLQRKDLLHQMMKEQTALPEELGS